MTLQQDLDSAASALKHVPEGVDLDDLRGLLRRAQAALEVVSFFRNPKAVHIERDGEGADGYLIIVTIQYDAVQEMLQFLYNYEGDW